MRLKDEEATEALAASVLALREQQVSDCRILIFAPSHCFLRREWKVNWMRFFCCLSTVLERCIFSMSGCYPPLHAARRPCNPLI